MHVVQTHAEFDLPIAQHVGIRCALGGVFAQEMREYALLVFGRKVRAMQRDVQRIADAARILEVLRGGAVGRRPPNWT